jgi:formiminoglutamase
MDKLPFLISIPHGGESIPSEIREDVCITPRDQFDDSDSFTNIIYDVKDIVEDQVVSTIARAFVDNSRGRDQLPPEFPDGLIKSATCYNRPIYKEGKQPNKEITSLLINKYYADYHRKLESALKNPKIVLALDCHSMAEIAPEVSPDSGSERPLINLGDAEGTACNSEITEQLRQSFIKVFGFSEDTVTINEPFKGGFITRHYGNNPIPWIQIEMNRKLYLSGEYFDYDSLQMKGNRLYQLNGRFREVLFRFHSLYWDQDPVKNMLVL